MSKFDGSTEALTYAEALLAIAARTAWPSEAHAAEVEYAIRERHGILPAPADVPEDPQTTEIAAQAAEIEQLRKQLAEKNAADTAAAQAAELAELRAQLAAQPAA